MSGPQRGTRPQPGTTDRGAHSVGDGGGRRRRGLLPLILGLLAALILAAILIATCGGDDDDEAANQATTPSAQTTPTTPAGDGATTPEPGTGGAEAEGDGDDAVGGTGGTGGTGAGGEGGQLVAGGQDLLPATAAQAGEDLVGQQAQGTRVRVQEVIAGEGFFVGTSQQDRRYVEFGGDVGQNEQGAAVVRDLQVGDVVNLEGEVRPSPEDPAQTLNLDEADARVVEQQGIFVNATEVTQAEE